MKTHAALLALSTLVVSIAAAQPAAKVGIVNLTQAILNTRDGRAARAYMEAEFNPDLDRLKKEEARLQAKRDQLKKISRHLWIPGRRRNIRKLTAEIESDNKTLRRHREDNQQVVETTRTRLMNVLGKRMNSFLTAYAKDYGYSLILQGDVITAAPELKQEDVTRDVVKRYDMAYPDVPQFTIRPTDVLH
jgi:Skp family chaperone for outer membrane proteins